MEFCLESRLRSFLDRLPIVCQPFFRAELAAACPADTPIKRPVKRTAHRRGTGLQNGEFQFLGCEVTLLKNQMKSAMMAKPADKNIQSGNSRVKVTLYGQVNRGIRFANTGDNTEITSFDNDGSSSRLGVRAVGKANPNLTIGALHELEWQENARSGTNASTDGGKTRVRQRHVDLWLDHKNLGKLSMGHGSIAGDAGGLYDLSGVGYVYGFAGANGTDGTKADASVKVANVAGDEVETVSVTGKARGFRPFNFFGARENRIRYDTPSLMGAGSACPITRTRAGRPA